MDAVASIRRVVHRRNSRKSYPNPTVSAVGWRKIALRDASNTHGLRAMLRTRSVARSAPWPVGAHAVQSFEAARFHQGDCWFDSGVAARRARAAVGAAGGRVPQQWNTGGVRAYGGRVSSGPKQSRLCRGSKLSNRVLLGAGPI